MWLFYFDNLDRGLRKERKEIRPRKGVCFTVLFRVFLTRGLVPHQPIGGVR